MRWDLVMETCIGKRPATYHTIVESLSTIVLNSRDWSEIIWLPRNSHFKISLPIGLYSKKPAGMHWLGRNDAVP